MSGAMRNNIFELEEIIFCRGKTPGDGGAFIFSCEYHFFPRELVIFA